MARTHLLVAEGGQAVHLPAGFDYADAQTELAITRVGDVITISPVRLSLKEAVERLQAMPALPTVELINRIEVPDREID